ncbi:hypothetical protein Q0A17_04135 [Citrobacter sp. S2-9]|uniref:Uncharacterized protein n=1 Tax=Citrobacter enshiensis TaxID=2971264 RepID=A0ABT8PS86_9ENTR|nr:hypothetical protein [Citrobacter enshiensis]MDN8598611.1 hypothetical protein [Citrobacter enshiensis]
MNMQEIKNAPINQRVGLLCGVQFQMDVQGAILAERELDGVFADDLVQRAFYVNAQIVLVTEEKAKAYVEKAKANPAAASQLVYTFKSSPMRAEQAFKQLCVNDPKHYFINPKVLSEYMKN